MKDTVLVPMPNSMEELRALLKVNTRHEGSGLSASTTHPCPYCGYPGWLTLLVVNDHEKVKLPRTCVRCTRVARLDILSTVGGLSTRLVFVSGPKPPDWWGKLPPPPPPAPVVRTGPTMDEVLYVAKDQKHS